MRAPPAASRSSAKACADPVRPRPRGGIVERDDEIRLDRRDEAPLDHAPGLEVVGQRHGAEIMAERRADPGGGGEHGGDAGRHDDVEGPPGRRAGLDRLEDRRRHGEDARIAARHHRHTGAAFGKRERMAGAVDLDAVVGGVAAGAARADARDIGRVADDVRRLGEQGARLRGEPALRPRPEPDHHQPAAHRQRPRPGTSTMAK